MTKRIIVSLAMIALVIAGVTSATVAYFSRTVSVPNNTFAMGTVDVINAGGLPYMFADMIPGEQRESDTIVVRNTGSMPIDLYVGMKGTDYNAVFNGVVDYAINEVNCSNGSFVYQWQGLQDLEHLFITWNKIGENIPAGPNKCYKAYVTPKASMPNEFQGRYAKTDVILYAVQAGVPVQLVGAPWQQ